MRVPVRDIEDIQNIEQLAVSLMYKLQSLPLDATAMYQLLAWAERKTDHLVQTQHIETPYYNHGE